MMTRKPFPAPIANDRIADLGFDLAAAAAVMNCETAGIGAYARAGGLDPAKDFRGLDLSGTPFAGQRLSGFDFSRCDLRGTGIERAIIDSTFVYDEAILDPGVVPGSDPEIGEFGGVSLRQIQEWVSGIHFDEDWIALAAFGAALLPILETETSPDDETTEVLDDLALSAAWGECYADAPAKALRRVDRLLARREGQRDLMTLAIRLLRSRSLESLGRYREALNEVDSLLLLDIEVRAPRDNITMATRFERASVLRQLGHYREALNEIDSLLPLVIEGRGPHNVDALTTRLQRALILQEFGRYREALDEADVIAPHYAHVKGLEDHYTIIARRSRAWLTYNVGRVDDALTELAELIELCDDDYQRAATRSLRCGILIAARRDFAHAEELRDIVATLMRATGRSHLLVLRTRYRLTRALFGSGERDAARAEIVATIADFDPATAPRENNLSATTRLLATIDGRDDGENLPE